MALLLHVMRMSQDGSDLPKTHFMVAGSDLPRTHFMVAENTVWGNAFSLK